jgi:hypothetical protein
MAGDIRQNVSAESEARERASQGIAIKEAIRESVKNSDPKVKEKARQEADEDERSKKIDNDIKEQDSFERKVYAYRVFTLICFWLLAVIIIMVADGKGDLHYSDTVIITLLTTTTANVIGLFAIVNNYLFKTRK